MSARAGWSGKLPAAGDFLARRVPPAFAGSWEPWLAGVLAGSRERLGARWQDAFLSAPAWRFVLPGGWAGVVIPSVDAVGRYYPLTLVCALGGEVHDAQQTLKAITAWLDTAEMLALSALAPDTDLHAFDDAVAALPLPAVQIDRAAALAARSKPVGAWHTQDSEVGEGWGFTSDGLPTVDDYCAMLTGQRARQAAAS